MPGTRGDGGRMGGDDAVRVGGDALMVCMEGEMKAMEKGQGVDLGVVW